MILRARVHALCGVQNVEGNQEGERTRQCECRSADDIAADVEPNYAHDDDRQAASTSQPLAPSVISSVSSTNQNQTNIVSPPPLAGMGNNEIAPNNDGQQSSLDIDGVDNPPPLLRTAAKCKDLEFGNVDVDDSDPMKSSANSSDDVIVVL